MGGGKGKKERRKRGKSKERPNGARDNTQQTRKLYYIEIESACWQTQRTEQKRGVHIQKRETNLLVGKIRRETQRPRKRESGVGVGGNAKAKNFLYPPFKKKKKKKKKK